MIARASSQGNRTKLELEYTGNTDLGREEGLFREQGGEKRRMGRETNSHRTGQRQFSPVQSIRGAIS